MFSRCQLECVRRQRSGSLHEAEEAPQTTLVSSEEPAAPAAPSEIDVVMREETQATTSQNFEADASPSLAKPEAHPAPRRPPRCTWICFLYTALCSFFLLLLISVPSFIILYKVLRRTAEESMSRAKFELHGININGDGVDAEGGETTLETSEDLNYTRNE